MRTSHVSSRRRRSLQLFGALGSAAVAVLAGPIHAQNVDWTNFANTNLWTDTDNWLFGALPTEFETAVFSLNTASTVSLGGSTQKVQGLLFNQAAAYNLTNGALTLNSLTQTGNVQNNIQVPITTFAPTTDALMVNVTQNQLQVQQKLTSAGIVKTGAGNLRLGTSGTAFDNAINGDIFLNAGTLTASAGATTGVNNPLAGTGNIVIGASGVTLSLQAQTNYDFGRAVVANDNSFTFTAGAAATDLGDFQLTIGKITIGNALLTTTAGNGYTTRTQELAINAGATARINPANTGQHFLVNKLSGDATTKIVKTGNGDLRILGNADNAASFAGDFDLNGGWLVLEALNGNQPLGNAATQINIIGNGNSTVSLRAVDTFDFQNINIVAGNNSFTYDFRRLSGTNTGKALSAGTVSIGNATMTVQQADTYTGRLAALNVDAGATTNLNINTNLRLDSLKGDAATTVQKNGGSTLFITAGNATDFKGALRLNGNLNAVGTTQIEWVTGESPTVTPASINVLGGSNLNLRANEDRDLGPGSYVTFGPGVLSTNIDVNRFDGTGTGRTFNMAGADFSGRTLRVAGGNSYILGLGSLDIAAGTTGVLNTDTAPAVVAKLTTGAGSTFNKVGGSTLTLTGDNSTTSSAPINVRAGALTTTVAGGFGTGLLTVGDTTPGATGFPNVASRLNYGAAGASANATGTDAIAIAGGVIDLNAVPTFDDIFEVRADGRIQGDAAQLAALKIGTNLTLSPNAIVLHDNPGAVSPVQGIETVADKSVFYGLSGNATSLPTVGAGTPWKGVSGDNIAARTIQTALTVNGGDGVDSTVEVTLQSMFDQTLNLGTTTANDAAFTWASANGTKITLAIGGTLGTTLGNVAGGRVAFNEAATASNINNMVDRVIVQGGSLLLLTANPLGGVPVDVFDGGSVDINNAANVFIDGPLTVKSGGVLFLNDNQVLGSPTATNEGTVTIETGGKLDIAGATPANIFTGSAANGQPINFTGTGHTVRFAANDIAQMDSTVPDQGVTYVVAGSGTAATIAGTNISVGTNTQTDGITLENGILTNDGSSRAFAGPIKLNNSNLTVAASRSTDFVVTSGISTTGNVQIGSLTPIDNRFKSLNSAAVNFAGLPDPYNSQTRVVFTGAFDVNNVIVHNTHLAFTNASTKIAGSLRVNGSVLYLDGGGPVTGGQGDLTGALADGTLAKGGIIIGEYSRAEMKLNLASDSNATVLNINQPIVIDANVNPLDRRSMWVSRQSGTNTRVNFNDITLNAGGVLGIQEDNTDIRVSLKVAGDSTVIGTTNIDYLDVTRVGAAPVLLQQGRITTFGAAAENVHSSNVFGTLGEGVQMDLIRGQLHFMAGSINNGIVRAHTAPAGGDAYVRSLSNSTSNTFTTDTVVGGTGRIEIGRSGAANGPEDYEILGTEVTNAAASQAPLHTHASEIRIVNDGDSSTIDAIVRSNRMNDSDRAARVQINDLKLADGSTVQLQSVNGIPLTIDTVTLLGSATIDTSTTGMTINTIAASSNGLGLTGAATPTIVNALTAGQVNIANGVNLQSTLTATGVNVTGGNANFGGAVTAPQVNVAGANATFNGNVAGALSIERGLASVVGNVSNGVAVKPGGVASFDGMFGETRTVAGPVSLDAGGLAITSGTLDLGTTVITSTSGEQTIAGLREARVSGSFNETAANTGNVVKLGPVMAQATTANGWKTDETYIYTGQLFVPNNNGDGTGSFAFAENFDDNVRIDIGGTNVLRNTVWNDSTGTGVLTLASGWHDIEVRLGQGGGGAGPSNNDGWNTALGLGIDLTLPIDPAAGANPNPSPVQVNFVAPLDNGLMNLFRTTVSSGVNVAAGSILNAGGMTNVGNLNLQGFGSEVNLNGGAGAAVASSVGAIAVSGSASGTMNIARAVDSLTAGALNLGGAFTKTGLGTTRVTGATTGSGDINVMQGALLLANDATSQTAGSVNVSAGAKFGGSLDIGGFLSLDGGSLSMTLAGLTAGSEYSQLSVAGGLTLTRNVELALELLFDPADNGSQKFVLIENNGFGTVTDGGFAFTFGGKTLKEGDIFTAGAGGFQGFQISYEGGDLVLTAVPEPTTIVSLLGGLGMLLGMRRFRRRG